MPLEGTLHRRGAWRRWAPVGLRLTDDKLAVVDLGVAGKPVKEMVVVVHVEALASKQKNEEFAFAVHFEGAAKKGILGGKDNKWLLKADSAEQYDKWVSTLTEAIRKAAAAANGEATPAATDGNSLIPAAASAAPTATAPPNGDYTYGLPPFDPRTDLPIANVPPEHATAFAFLKMAVIHWIDSVKCLTADFGNDERVAILGDKCVYLCTPTADVKRCVRVVDIQKILVAQDSKKDLYIIIVMPKTIEADGKTIPEYDMMFHCADIKSFVRYLRTVYMHATQGQLLPLEQLRDKQQLETEIALAAPQGWTLKYWQPMLKEHLKTVLDMWQKSNKFEENERFKQQVASALGGGDVLGEPTPPPQPPAYAMQHVTEQVAHSAPVVEESTTKGDEGFGPTMTDLPPGGEDDPLGRFLQQAGVAQYYESLVENKITLDILNSGLIDDMDLQHFGVAIPAHRQRILERAADADHVAEAKKAPPPKPAAAAPVLDDDDDDLDLGLDLDAPKKKEKSVFDDSLLDMDFGEVTAATTTSPAATALEKEEANARAGIASEETSSWGDITAAHTAFAPVSVACDVTTPLGKFLSALNIPQYYGFLSERDITLETLACGLVDDESLKLFGIENPKHRDDILKGLEDRSLVGDSALDWISDKEDPIEPLKRLEFSSRSEIRESESATRTALAARFTEEMPAPTEIDLTDPLARFLKAISLPQYYWGLSAKDMSLEVLTSGLVDEDDLQNHCDISNATDRRRLQEALKDEVLVKAATDGEDLAGWSVAGAAKQKIVQSQNKIMEIGGLSIDDDLLGGIPPPAAAAAPAAAPAPAVKEPPKPAPAAAVDDLLGSAAAPAAPAPAAAPPAAVEDDLLGGPAVPAAAPAAPANGAAADDVEDLLGGPAVKKEEPPAAAAIDVDL